jgi:ankyrin repeat protein
MQRPISPQPYEAMAFPDVDKITTKVSIARDDELLLQRSTTDVAPAKRLTAHQFKHQSQMDGICFPMNDKRGTTTELDVEKGLVEDIGFNDTKGAPVSESATNAPSEYCREFHESNESFTSFFCGDGDNANTNNYAAEKVGLTCTMSVSLPAQDTPERLLVRKIVNEQPRGSPNFSQILRKTEDSNDVDIDRNCIDEAANGAIHLMAIEDINQLGATHCDFVSAFEAITMIGATGDIEPSPEESLSSVFSSEILHELYRHCMDAKTDENGITDPSKWEPVRYYLLANSDLVQTAARIQSPGGLTPFHQICRHNPPLDIVELFVASAGLEIMSWTDKRGMLPLHYACAYNASIDVIEALVLLYPESRLKQDAKGETPLHYAVTNMSLSVDAIEKVCVKGSASAADHLGMLPFHYAIMHRAYFNLSTAKVLVHVFPEGLTCPDRIGRIPILSLVKSCHLPETLDLLEFTFALNPALCKGDIGLMLLNNLGDCARRIGKSENIQILLSLLLDHNPAPSYSFLATLNDLQRWLKKGDKFEKKSVLQKLMRRKRNIL